MDRVDLTCIECKQTCGCLIYGKVTPHVHLAGGHPEYELCEPCLQRFYERHRPTVRPGAYAPWKDDCGENCGFCHLMRKFKAQRSQ